MMPINSRTRSFILAGWLMVGMLALADAAPAPVSTTNLVAGNNKFALDLFGQLRATDGNLFFSPYSISSCLGMTSAGARGKTGRQMAKVLHFDGAQEPVQAAFSELQKRLNELGKSGPQLAVANALWAQQDHPFLPAFLDVVRNRYEAGVNQVDFKTGVEPVRNDINHWVAEKTHGKINEIIGRGALDGTTRLVLVNAIYFKGAWARPFNTNSTIDAPFWPASGAQVPAKLMIQSARFTYAEPEGLQVLELPYAGRGLSMVILLPRERDGIKALESSLSPAKLDQWLDAAQIEKVDVLIPRFRLETKFLLNGELAKMGMSDAFGPKADFSGMDGDRDLYISAVVHKAFVEVNEEGTEAAAATGVTMSMLAMAEPRPPPTFRADHPFIFLIRDNASGSILFLGRLANPEK